MRTDQDILKWISKLRESTGRLAPWHLKHSESAFDVVERAGIKRLATDVLSLLATTEKDNSPPREDLPFVTFHSTHKLGDTYIFAMDTRMRYSVHFETDNPGLSLDRSPAASELLVEQAQKRYSKTTNSRVRVLYQTMRASDLHNASLTMQKLQSFRRYNQN